MHGNQLLLGLFISALFRPHSWIDSSRKDLWCALDSSTLGIEYEIITVFFGILLVRRRSIIHTIRWFWSVIVEWRCKFLHRNWNLWNYRVLRTFRFLVLLQRVFRIFPSILWLVFSLLFNGTNEHYSTRMGQKKYTEL